MHFHYHFTDLLVCIKILFLSTVVLFISSNKWLNSCPTAYILNTRWNIPTYCIFLDITLLLNACKSFSHGCWSHALIIISPWKLTKFSNKYTREHFLKVWLMRERNEATWNLCKLQYVFKNEPSAKKTLIYSRELGKCQVLS